MMLRFDKTVTWGLPALKLRRKHQPCELTDLPLLIEPKARQIEVEFNAVFFFLRVRTTAHIIEYPEVLWDISRETAEPHDAGTKRMIAKANGRAARIGCGGKTTT